MKDLYTSPQSAVAVVRGMGVYCPLATNCTDLEAALSAGEDSIREITSFDTKGFLSHQASAFAAQVPMEFEPGATDWMDRATLFTIAAYEEAIAQANIDLQTVDPTRIAVCLGSSHSGLVRTEDVARAVRDDAVADLDPKVISATLVSHCTAVIKRMSGAKGRIMTVSSACASSNSAIGIAADLIRRGEADVVIAGGADTVSLSVMAGFNALRALAPGKSAPFSQDVGLSIGEGAGIVVLSAANLEAAQDAPNLAHVLGYGLSGDAHHATSPDQDGAGAARAIVAALKDAAICAADVSYVNAHGTGTQANDAAESRAIYKLFGNQIPVSSTKSYYGHTLGASGVIEAITSILMAQKGRAPANLRMHRLRDGCEALNYATQATQTAPDATLLVNNFGFGGNNSSLLMRVGAFDADAIASPAAVDEVVITGAGACSAAGPEIAAFYAALDAGVSLAELDDDTGIAVANVGPLRFTTPDLKPFARTSPTSKHALLALKEALGDDTAIYHENQQSGLIGGMVFGAQKSTEKYMESVFMGDPSLANAHHFPMITMNATGGATSLAYQIKGYTTTVCGSASALAYSADLAANGRQERIAIVSGDEMTPRLTRLYHRTGVVSEVAKPRTGRADAMGEFGAAITVERASAAAARGAQVLARLTGWATRQDPMDLSVGKDGAALARAVNAALAQAGRVATEVQKLVLLDCGLAPTSTATRHALEQVFAGVLPEITRPAQVFGYAPSSGAMMTVLAALNAPKAVTLAAGYDVIGEAFAFVIEGAAQ